MNLGKLGKLGRLGKLGKRGMIGRGSTTFANRVAYAHSFHMVPERTLELLELLLHISNPPAASHTDALPF
jgi:hypothetical protein